MQLTKILLLAGTALAPAALADCFKSGPEGINRSWAMDQLKTVCNTYMLGSYEKGQQRHACLTDTNQISQWFFTIKLRDDRNFRVMNEEECLSGLGKEITGCDLGGHSKYDNWEYTSDPNRGACADIAFVGKRDVEPAPVPVLFGGPISPAIKGRRPAPVEE
ncbi:hypothetical protein AJ79_03867 [Helicocarpus griseus UAMH5409]|uniref:Glycan binding protein Y3-like domain-containing protein n=1 Tax=Helicocarpus griseus UAMH5409 TaxID=1447875 RepID=A0A2B7XW31_9EURO|nr:hypothetical protein AJ79_03867 [Helicocarpus griseus UAMH5409]